SKYLYDDAGSALFERICDLPEYYPTRTELRILEDAAPAVARIVGPRPTIVEFGSGASVKVRLLLDAFAPSGGVASYVAVDISDAALAGAEAALRAGYPDLRVHSIHADYTKPFRLPDAVGAGPVLGFFPGSTIGNFTPDQARAFLANAAEDVGPGGWLLLGVDLVKDEAVLTAAYDDAAGVTAAFNKNLLIRINRELGADFDADAFDHKAIYNASASRIEMHLESRASQIATVAGQRFAFAAGETIHTENSHKYRPDEVAAMAAAAGFETVERFSDADRLFAVVLLRAGGRSLGA
ncbi:MAG: L-histidine N(alpha)-methyltransferase, partial [Pseudomonadota bacterium]